MKRFALTIAMTFILVGSVFAQNRQGPGDPNDPTDPVPTNSYNEKMSGLETAKGTDDFEDDIVWGRSITMAGELGEFTASIHRSGVKVSPELGHRIVGGTWTLHIYKGGQLRGMLFGEFTGGMIQWITDKSGNIVYETVDGTLTITGGTGEFETKGGPYASGTMTSIGEVDTKTFPIHKGSVSLIF